MSMSSALQNKKHLPTCCWVYPLQGNDVKFTVWYGGN